MYYYQQPGFPGGFPGGHPGGQPGGAPMSSPPPFTPPIPAWQVGSQGIRGCINRNTYVWMDNGSEFWFFPTFVGRQTIIGFQWRRFGWIYNVIDSRRIRTFQCF
jgi:hypothetical protein